MDTKYLKNVFTYILFALLAIGIGYYVLYHAFDGFSSSLSTAPAQLCTESETYSAEAYIFRDEKPIYSNYGGAVNYIAEDGDKVGVGDLLAEVYRDGDGAELRKKVSIIDDKIALLEKSNIDRNMVDMDLGNINNQISELYLETVESIADGDLSFANFRKDEMLSRINRKKIIIEEVKNYNDQIAQLKIERAQMTAILGDDFEKVFSPQSAYFFFDVDGFEGVYSSKEITTMSLGDFERCFSANKQNAEDAGHAVGKLVYGHVWYIAVPVSNKEASDYKVGNSYNINFTHNYDVTVKMTLERSVTESGKGGVLVFSSSRMPEDFNYARSQTVVIEKNNVTGYRIPISAVRVVDSEKGVYILYGRTVYFRRIEILLESDGYVIVAREPESKDGSIYLGASDTVITRGKDLYDGKIIE